MELDDITTMRYCRQILLPSVSEDGQEKLMNSHALVVGAGGLGCAVLPYLAAAGIGKISVFDADHVELTNLQRQILHSEDDIGRLKVDSATDTLRQLNHYCEMVSYAHAFEEADQALIDDVDVVIDCSDNLPTRLLLNRLCWQKRTALISGSAIRMEGQLIHFAMEDGQPCYACMASLFGEQQLTCMESGVLSPVVGTIGTLQATEALKQLIGIAPAAPKLMLYDGLNLSFNEFKLVKQPGCPVCSQLR